MEQMPSYLQFLLDKACIARVPASGTFELTARCNFDCRMCFIHKHEADAYSCAREMNTAWWLDMAQQLHDAGCLTLLITGGEPLLRPDFAEIYLRCRKLGLLVSVNTNAALITPELIDLFSANKPLRLNISLYGANEQSYRSVCGKTGMYERVRENLLVLRARDVDIKLNYTVSEYNIADAEQLFAFANKNGIQIQAATYLFPPIRACGENCDAQRSDAQTAAAYQYRCDLLRLSPEELAQKRQAAAKFQQPAGEPPLKELAATQERLFCRAGTSSFWITWDGMLLSCGMLPQPSCSLKQTPFLQAWEAIKTQTARLMLPTRCTTCEKRQLCDMCAAGCYAETGSTDRTPDYLCEKTDAYIRWLSENNGESDEA